MFRFGIFSILIGVSFNAISAAPEKQTLSWQTTSVEQSDAAEIRVSKSSQTINDNEQLSEKQRQTALAKSPDELAKNQSDHQIWVYDAWVTLKRDTDHDDYYSELELGIDVDTHLAEADVYARIFLGDGQVFREIYTTSDFHIHADDSHDEKVVTTQLIEGFSSDDYDILIEIYDAVSDELQDSYDHTSDNDLYLLPLESSEYETRNTGGGQIVINTEEAGSNSILMMLLLSGFILLRRKMKF